MTDADCRSQLSAPLHSLRNCAINVSIYRPTTLFYIHVLSWRPAGASQLQMSRCRTTCWLAWIFRASSPARIAIPDVVISHVITDCTGCWHVKPLRTGYKIGRRWCDLMDLQNRQYIVIQFSRIVPFNVCFNVEWKETCVNHKLFRFVPFICSKQTVNNNESVRQVELNDKAQNCTNTGPH